MKVFVAAESTGADGDFAWTVPGELVHLPAGVCDCPDCGCDRGMGGFVSHKGTTCFVVRDLEIDADTYSRLMWETLRDGGWVSDSSDEDLEWVGEWAREHLDLASSLPAEVPLMVQAGRVLVRSRQ